MPYEEIHHTADWGLRVWAADLPSLFIEAGRGMLALMGARPLAPDGESPVQTEAGQDTEAASPRRFTLTAPDPEALLVAFLSELLYLVEHERLMLADLRLTLLPGEETWQLHAEGLPRPLASVQKLIKAVTFYNLHIQSDENGYSVEVVFDV